MLSFFFQRGFSALMYAVRGNHLHVVKELVLSQAELKIRDKVRMKLNVNCCKRAGRGEEGEGVNKIVHNGWGERRFFKRHTPNCSLLNFASPFIL